MGKSGCWYIKSAALANIYSCTQNSDHRFSEESQISSYQVKLLCILQAKLRYNGFIFG